MAAPPQPFTINLTGQDQADIKAKKTGAITDKDLSTLPELITNATAITNLNLDLRANKAVTDGGVSGVKTILSQLTSLKKLRLNLTDCDKISDDSIEAIMDTLSKLTALEDLSLILEGCTKVKGAALLPILKGLKPLVNLTSLELTPPKISDNLMEEFQFTVSKLEKLTTLTLRFGAKDKREGSLSDKGFSELAKTFENLPRLENLYLDLFRGDWNITDESVVNLAAAIFKQKGLLSLRLNLRGIDVIQEIGVSHLCEAITKLKKLRKLHLNFKTDNEENIFALKMPLSVLLELRQLHLDFSWGVTDATLDQLREAFANMEHLHQLIINFSGCRDITNQGCIILKDIIMSLPSLNDLRLEIPWCYSITNNGLIEIAEAVANVPALTQLAINYERGKKEDEEEDYEPVNVGIAEIFRAIGEQPNIKILNLNFANCLSLTDADIGALAESLEALEHLTNLMLDLKLCDKLSDIGVGYLMEGMRDLPQLNNILFNFLWCDKISEKAILQLLELKKAKKIPQFSIAYRKDEPRNEEGGGCNMF